MTDKKEMEKIIERVNKLMRLATNEGATENEAATAMKRARSLIDKYQLSQMDLDSDNSVKGGIGTEEQHSKKGNRRKAPPYAEHLAIAIAKFNDCIVTYKAIGGMYYLTFQGCEGDAVTSMMMLEYLKKHCNSKLTSLVKSGELERNSVNTRSFRRSYASRINERFIKIHEERIRETQVGTGGKSLVSLKKQIVEKEFGAAEYKRGRSSARVDSKAANMGSSYADKAHLGNQIGTSGGAQGKLK